MTETSNGNNQDDPEYRDVDEPESTKEADERERAQLGDYDTEPGQPPDDNPANYDDLDDRDGGGDGDRQA